MIEAQALAEAKRETYRTRSRGLLVVVLLLLAAFGVVLPLFLTPYLVRYYGDMAVAMPAITQYAIVYSQQAVASGTVIFLGTGFLGTVLVVKEILAGPKVRYWVNIVTLLLLLISGICYACALLLPIWYVLHATQ
ncbi:MAG: hypothetical protein GY842_27750 [bacterium]|nr:hypothetical protein [bacterium]